MKNNKRTTICAIIVLSCLLIGFFVIMIRNKDLKPSIDYYKKDGVIVDNKSIIETPKEELRNSDGIIIKQIVKNT